MLSQKLQKDLMNAYAAVHEEKRGHAAGASDTEKQASQLASDVRYKARGKVKDGASDEEKKKVFMQILGASPAPQAVKAMAKQKLLGEEVVGEGIGNVVKSIMKGSAQKQRYGMTGSDMSAVKKTSGDFSAMRAKRKEQIGGSKIHNQRQLDKFIDKSEKGNVPVVTKGSGEFGSDTAIKRKYNPNKGVELTDKFGKGTYPSKQYDEEVVHEMRFDDGKEGTAKRLKALAKKRKMSMSKMKDHPQFQPESFSKTGMSKGTGKAGGAMKNFLDKKAKKLQKEYDSQSKEKKNNPAFQSNKLNPKPVYNSHEPQGEVVSEKKKESNPKNLTLPKGVKSGVDYTKTGSSTAYMGEAKKAKKDYDGDGKVESGTQEFLGSRDKAIKKAIAKRRGRVKEGFSAWRIDLDFQESVKK